MKKPILTSVVMIAMAITTSNAQVGIGVSTANINPSAQLEVNSTTKGFLPPRMTASQRNLITVNAASAGLTIWCTNCGTSGELQVYNGTTWTNMVGAATATPTTTSPSPSNPVVTIGNQIWTSLNLNVSTYRDGTPIPKVENNTTWTSLTTGAYCYYNNDSATYAAIYGKLYNWYAVAGIYDEASFSNASLRKNLAPEGYHIPSDAEWTTLTSYLQTFVTPLGAGVGTQMKSSYGWGQASGNGTNSSGFDGRPGGIRFPYYTSQFIYNPWDGYWWSSTEDFVTGYLYPAAWYRLLDWTNGNATRVSDNKKNGMSVRCLKD